MQYRTVLSDIREERTAAEGEHDLRIFNVKPVQSERDNAPDWNVGISIEDDPDAKPMYHPVWLPFDPQTGENRDIEDFTRRSRDLARFLVLFRVPMDGDNWDTESFPGLTATAQLGIRAGQDRDGNPFTQNTLRCPKLKDE